MVQVDSSQRMLRMADPDSRHSGFYSMPNTKQNNLQADSFYQTVWDTSINRKTIFFTRYKKYKKYTKKKQLQLCTCLMDCIGLVNSCTTLRHEQDGLHFAPTMCQRERKNHSRFSLWYLTKCLLEHFSTKVAVTMVFLHVIYSCREVKDIVWEENPFWLTTKQQISKLVDS